MSTMVKLDHTTKGRLLREALRALDEFNQRAAGNEAGSRTHPRSLTRKLFLMLPMWLHCPPGGSLISRKKLMSKLEALPRGQWWQMIEESRVCNWKAAASRHCGRRRRVDDVEQCATRAEMLIQLRELSAARQALEGAGLAPSSQATLDALEDARRRPPRTGEPLPPDLLTQEPESVFEFDEHLFNKHLRSTRRWRSKHRSSRCGEKAGGTNNRQTTQHSCGAGHQPTPAHLVNKVLRHSDLMGQTSLRSAWATFC